jgi:hypothetical protein
MAIYVLTHYPTPVFNTPDLTECFGGKDGDTLPLDNQCLMRTVETILFPRSRLEVLEQVANPSILKIRSEEYPYPGDYYVDSRFIENVPGSPRQRVVEPPSIPTMISDLVKLEGTPYIWGGNWPEGIPLLPQLYPSKTRFEKLDVLTQNTWQLKGVDCTGLLYYTSNGYTRRNTSDLVNIGKSVQVQGLSAEEIIEKVEDLDLIVWRGHVICVVSKNEAIESNRMKNGVVITDLFDRLSEIMNERKPVNDWNGSAHPSFVVRRWHPDNI